MGNKSEIIKQSKTRSITTPTQQQERAVKIEISATFSDAGALWGRTLNEGALRLFMDLAQERIDAGQFSWDDFKTAYRTSLAESRYFPTFSAVIDIIQRDFVKPRKRKARDRYESDLNVETIHVCEEAREKMLAKLKGFKVKKWGREERGCEEAYSQLSSEEREKLMGEAKRQLKGSSDWIPSFETIRNRAVNIYNEQPEKEE